MKEPGYPAIFETEELIRIAFNCDTKGFFGSIPGCMSKIITWALDGNHKDAIPHETNSLFYAEDFIRYYKYHTPYSIKYCLAGEMTYIAGNEKKVVKPNHFFITNHGTELECLPVSKGTKGLIIFFTETFISEVASTFLSGNESLESSLDASSICLPIFDHIYRCTAPIAQYINAISNQMKAAEAIHDTVHLATLFYHFAENMLDLNGQTQQQINNLKARSPGTRYELFRRVHSASDFMRDHWFANPGLEDIARQACLSPYHFHRSFLEAFGEPPMTWFRKLKMDKARDMLTQNKLTVSEVAIACGFSDVFSFSKTFKRMYAVSPSRLLREAIHQENSAC